MYEAKYDINTAGNYAVSIGRYYDKLDMGNLKNQCMQLLELKMPQAVQYLKPIINKVSSP